MDSQWYWESLHEKDAAGGSVSILVKFVSVELDLSEEWANHQIIINSRRGELKRPGIGGGLSFSSLSFTSFSNRCRMLKWNFQETNARGAWPSLQ